MDIEKAELGEENGVEDQVRSEEEEEAIGLNIPIMLGGKEHRIQSDLRNYIISIPFTNKKGEAQYKQIRFYSTLKGLIDGLFEMKVRKEDARSLTDLQFNIKRIKEELLGIYDGNKT